MVPLAFCIPGIRRIEKSAPLSTCKPVSEPHAELLRSLHSTDARHQIGTQQTVVGGLISESAHRRQPQVYRCRSQTSSLKFIAISKNDGSAKCQTRFGAVPGNEVVDRERVGSLGGNGTEALQNGSLGMIKVGQTQHVLGLATVRSMFLWHGRGLPNRRSMICPVFAFLPETPPSSTGRCNTI